MNEQRPGMPETLEDYETMCRDGLRKDSERVVESGSAFAGIVGGLIGLFNMSRKEAVRRAKQLECQVGFRRGGS